MKTAEILYRNLLKEEWVYAMESPVHVGVGHVQKCCNKIFSMKIVHFFLFIVVCCIGCQQNSKQPSVSVLDFQPDSCLKELDISKILEDTVEVIKLETTDGSLLGNIDKIIVTDKYIFVSDLHIGQKNYMFDRRGKFVRTISDKGADPGEYSVIGDFTIKGDSLLIQDYYQNKYLVYHIAVNQLMNDIHYTVHHTGTVALGNDLYLVSNNFTTPLGDYNCFKFNLNTKKTTAYLPFVKTDQKKNIGWTLNHPCDYINASKAFAYYCSNDTVYEIEKTGIIPQYVIQFSKMAKETDAHSSERGGRMLGIVHLQQSEKYILGTYTLGKGFRYFFVNKSDLSHISGEVLRINKMNNKTILGEYFIQDDYLTFWETMPSLKFWRKYFDKSKFTNMSNKEKIQEAIDSSKEEDNPLLFRFKLKE